jgi:hypothetical protein
VCAIFTYRQPFEPVAAACIQGVCAWQPHLLVVQRHRYVQGVVWALQWHYAFDFHQRGRQQRFPNQLIRELALGTRKGSTQIHLTRQEVCTRQQEVPVCQNASESTERAHVSSMGRGHAAMAWVEKHM